MSSCVCVGCKALLTPSRHVTCPPSVVLCATPKLRLVTILFSIHLLWIFIKLLHTPQPIVSYTGSLLTIFFLWCINQPWPESATSFSHYSYYQVRSPERFHLISWSPSSQDPVIPDVMMAIHPSFSRPPQFDPIS